MRKIIFIFLVSFTISSFSQILIKGTVFQQNGPLENVAVYLNNTMIGTTTNENGEFSIPVKPGQYDLIVSYLGFKKINYSLNTANYKKPLVFILEEDDEMLDEIIIKKTVYDDEWKYNLAEFKKQFIGKSELSKDCEIKNPEVLHFDYNALENILTAYARKPIEIFHKGLGYSIIYELEHFERNKNYVSYLGYSRYQELKGSKRKQKRWEANRLKTYNGSYVHFYQSLLKGTTYKEGFLIHLFKRVPNPERPSEAEIKKARELVKLSLLTINFTEKISVPKTALDSARVLLKKVKLPKYKDNIYKSKAPITDIFSRKNMKNYLNIAYNILVVYTKEKEEIGYIKRNTFGKMREAYPQSSSVIPLKKPSVIDMNGILVDPLDVYYEGYWSYEKFANALPLDYEPVLSKQ